MHYSVVKRRDEWVISVDGTELIRCKQRKMALRIAKQATITLTQWHRDMERGECEVPPLNPVLSHLLCAVGRAWENRTKA